MIVGEGPGLEEDLHGEPFVGSSGRLLDKMLRSAGIPRDSVIITNTVRCRPPQNRAPLPDEIQACKAWLWQEIKMVDPLVVVTLGKTPSKLLLKGKSGFSITQAVGKPRKVDFLHPDSIVVPMFHPSYLLRGKMKQVEDMVQIFVKVRNYITPKTS